MHTSPPPVVVSSLPVSPIFRRPLHHAALRSAAIRANSSRRARDQRLCQESWRLLWDNAGLSDQATPGERRLAGSDEKQTHYSTERERERERNFTDLSSLVSHLSFRPLRIPPLPPLRPFSLVIVSYPIIRPRTSHHSFSLLVLLFSLCFGASDLTYYALLADAARLPLFAPTTFVHSFRALFIRFPSPIYLSIRYLHSDIPVT
ncbi:hypothetical protein M430DRAFT_269820, partial [Amorphotheca resinae ATCC 22711]